MRRGVESTFGLMFLVMLTIAAGNTALQSVLPALGRSLGVKDSAVAAAFSVSALLWVLAAPFWANRSDRHGRRLMILLGLGGFCISLLLCGLFLAAGINGRAGAIAGNVNANYRSAVFTDVGTTQGQSRVPGRTVVNARLGYDAGRWTVFAFARNLLDEDYLQYRTPDGNRGIVGDPQTFGVGVELHL